MFQQQRQKCPAQPGSVVRPVLCTWPACLGGLSRAGAQVVPSRSLDPCAQLSQVAEVGGTWAGREAPVEAGQAPRAAASSATFPGHENRLVVDESSGHWGWPELCFSPSCVSLGK